MFGKIIAALLFSLCLSTPSFADDYIVVVFDTSGSMSKVMDQAKETRIKAAQNALISVLTKVPASTNVGIVTFTGWAYDLQPVNRDKLQIAIQNTRPDGGTPLYKFIKKGADRLLEERKKQVGVGSYKLLVVTDGEADDSELNRDSTSRYGILNDVISRGIIVDAIGLEMGNGHSLRTKINGTYMAGNDPDSIQKSLSKLVSEVGFDSKDGVNQEAFDVINQMPESFTKASITGLTEFSNQPIGELNIEKTTKEKEENSNSNIKQIVVFLSAISVLSLYAIVIYVLRSGR